MEPLPRLKLKSRIQLEGSVWEVLEVSRIKEVEYTLYNGLTEWLLCESTMIDILFKQAMR